MWRPDRYLHFAGERARPFADLVAAVPLDRAGLVVDLGCGPGNLTATLAERFGAEAVIGIDPSPEMIAAAGGHAGGVVRFEQADARTWTPPGPVDVLVANAVLQWIDDHVERLAGWLGWLRPGGWLAFQVPGNFGSPSHTSIEEQLRSAPWRDLVAPDVLERPDSAEPGVYLAHLRRLATEVSVWETTYHHVLEGPDPVLTWIRATALRPVLAALAVHGEATVAAFEAELADRLRRAYPPGSDGTVFPFRRIFAVARRR